MTDRLSDHALPGLSDTLMGLVGTGIGGPPASSLLRSTFLLGTK